MKKLVLRAFAKVNLSLNITGKTPNGMHELDSVMMSVDKFDTLTVAERADDKINVSFVNADIPTENNTAYKAARAVMDVIGKGVDIEIEKGIPMGAGLGGSSADGAAVLRALDIFYRLPERGIDMRKLALSVGSDVPFMLTGGLCRVRGTGDELFFMENKLNVFMVGLMPCAVSTAQAYSAFDELTGGKLCPTDTDKLCESLLAGERSALDFLGNALYTPAVKLAPQIAQCAEKLKSFGATVNMTGSGGTVLGYFTDINAFAQCAAALKNESGVMFLCPAKTGVLHEWIARE